VQGGKKKGNKYRLGENDTTKKGGFDVEPSQEEKPADAEMEEKKGHGSLKKGQS